MLIHFICRGNVFRSLTAETYLRSLNLPNVDSMSSGTNVNSSDPQERIYFNNTLELLERHNINQLAKNRSDKLTQLRLDQSDLVVIVNQRAYEEADSIFSLPANTVVWSVVDIGEGNRIDTGSNRLELEELIFNEVTSEVDTLVSNLHSND